MSDEAERQPTRPHSLGRFLNFATSAVNARCNADLARHDLTLPQWVVLSALWQRDNLTVSDIAAYTGNAGPAASRIIDRMVGSGLIGRRPDAADRRSSRVFLTARGESLRHLQRFHEHINRLLLDGLTDRQARDLFDLLDHVMRQARAGQDPGEDQAPDQG